MGPAFKEANETGVQPYLAGKISQDVALENALSPLRKFMFRQTRDTDLGLFLKLAKIEAPKTRADVPTIVLVPAFVVSELKTAFQIGFIIFLPFLVIDIVASSVLMAMGMMMLPPVVISLPFKIMLFVLVDGWGLLIGSMVKSFG
jgi:flagellar biosynthetic protein FliP